MKKLLYIFFLIIVSDIYAENKAFNHNTHFQKDNVENMLSDKVFGLVEVKRLDKELKRRFHANASIWVYSKPTKAYPYYTIYAGYVNPQRYETRYNFRIKGSDIYKTHFSKYVELWDGPKGEYVLLLKARESHP